MKSISLKELIQLQEDLQARSKQYKLRVLMCMTGCRALGAQDVAAALKQKLKDHPLKEQIDLVETGCIGLCAKAPVMLIQPYGYLYGGVKPEDVDAIISETLEKGQPVERLAVKDNKKPVPLINDVPFYKEQKQIVLENCGRIDPRKIEGAIATGTYIAAVRTITENSPSR